MSKSAFFPCTLVPKKASIPYIILFTRMTIPTIWFKAVRSIKTSLSFSSWRRWLVSYLWCFYKFRLFFTWNWINTWLLYLEVWSLILLYLCYTKCLLVHKGILLKRIQCLLCYQCILVCVLWLLFQWTFTFLLNIHSLRSIFGNWLVILLGK